MLKKTDVIAIDGMTAAITPSLQQCVIRLDTQFFLQVQQRTEPNEDQDKSLKFVIMMPYITQLVLFQVRL